MSGQRLLFKVAPAPSGPTSSASPDPQRLPAGICCLLAPPSSDKSGRAHVASIDGHESPVMFPSACQQLSFGLLASPAGLGFRWAAAVLLSLPLVQAWFVRILKSEDGARTLDRVVSRRSCFAWVGRQPATCAYDLQSVNSSWNRRDLVRGMVTVGSPFIM